MLYLEDYIELIEQLPQDLRDRFTDMRELDLKVQNTIDALDSRVRRFFSEARKTKPEVLEEEYKSIHSCYKLTLDDAEEKVSMASQIYDLVDRHLRKLDQELSRFKMELEADCSGITEILERRSMLYNEDTSVDLLYNDTYNHSTNASSSSSNSSASSTSSSNTANKNKFGNIDRLATATLVNGISEKSSYSNMYSPLGAHYPLTKSPNISSSPSLATPKLSKSVSTSGLTNTSKSMSENLKEQGRGVQASLKARTAAQKKAEQLENSLSLTGLLGPTATSKLSNSSSYVDVTGNSYLSSSSLSQKQPIQNRSQKVGRKGHKTISTQSQSNLSQSEKSYPEPSLDWVPDPNEPTYCLCNQVSYGEMVGCDNTSCPVEWFHYGCVGLTDAPKGKWYCPDCSSQMKKRRIR